MVRPKLLVLWILLACLAALLVSLNGCGGVSSKNITPPPPPPNKIQHVVILFQENRTPDNLFQDPVLISRGADIQNYGYSLTTKIMLQPIDLGTNGANPQNYDLSHAHMAFEAMYDGGLMDGAAAIACTPAAQCPPNAHQAPQFMYVNPADVQPYFALAEQYTFGDRMFQTNQGPSMPAHQYIIAGTSWAGTITGQATTLFQAENPQIGPGPSGASIAAANTGCASPSDETVNMIDITQPWPNNEATTMYPCWEHATLMDVLDANKISWRYYANVGNCTAAPCPNTGIWVGPNAIQHMCHASGTAAGQPCDNPEWMSNVVSEQNILTDIPAGNLPAVSWVIPDGKESDHALSNTGEGPSWVASIVNAIGNSQYWKNTAIIITWDDWGGWYDHVPPPVRSNNSYEVGFRVPLIVVSPYAKAQYISHTPHDFGSILKFIEETFSLPQIDPTVTIGQTTGFGDTNALDDLSDCFDYTQTPLTFQTIPSQYDAQHFLNDRRPPSDPDDD